MSLRSGRQLNKKAGFYSKRFDQKIFRSNLQGNLHPLWITSYGTSRKYVLALDASSWWGLIKNITWGSFSTYRNGDDHLRAEGHSRLNVFIFSELPCLRKTQTERKNKDRWCVLNCILDCSIKETFFFDRKPNFHLSL